MNYQRNLFLIKIYNFMFDFRPFAFIMAIYFSEILNSYIYGMSIFTLIYVLNAIFEIPTGILSDKIGRKLTLSLAALSMMIAIIFYISKDSYYYFLLGGLFQSISSSLKSGTDDAFIFENIKNTNQDSKKEKIWGSTNSMYHFGEALATMIAGLILLSKGENIFLFKILFLSSLFSQFICFFLPYFMFETNNKKSQKSFIFLINGFNSIKNNVRLRNLYFAQVIQHSIRENIYLFETNFTKGFLPIYFLGFLRSIAHLFMATSYLLSSKIIKFFGYKKTIFYGLFFNFLIDMLATLINSIISPFIFATYWIFSAPKNVAKKILMQEEFSNSERATIGSIISFSSSILIGIFSLVVGFIAEVYSPFWAILFCAFFSKVLSLPFYLKALKCV